MDSYDVEIAQFTRNLAEDGLIHSGMAAAESNVLANTGTGPIVDVARADKVPGSEDVQEQPRDEL